MTAWTAWTGRRCSYNVQVGLSIGCALNIKELAARIIRLISRILKGKPIKQTTTQTRSITYDSLVNDKPAKHVVILNPNLQTEQKFCLFQIKMVEPAVEVCWSPHEALPQGWGLATAVAGNVFLLRAVDGRVMGSLEEALQLLPHSGQQDKAAMQLEELCFGLVEDYIAGHFV